MNKQEIHQLAALLVKWHNQTEQSNCSFYGANMDRALARDTFSTLYTQGEYSTLHGIQQGFKIHDKDALTAQDAPLSK